jgi:hypothetical protein
METTAMQIRSTPEPEPEPAPIEIRRALAELIARIGDSRVAVAMGVSRFMLALVSTGAPVPVEAVDAVRLGLADGMPDVGALPGWAR